MMEREKASGTRIFEYGKQVDFGNASADYGRWRAGFPDELYLRLEACGVGVTGQRILDLATGTGFLGRGFARRGCVVTGLDISWSLMNEARRLDSNEGLAMNYLRAKAESLPLCAGAFDLVSAGQSWHWFDGVAVANEARRVLRAGGWLVIAHFDWIPLPGNVAEATEQLIMRHNPAWHMGGGVGIHPAYTRDVGLVGFVDLETF
jgi:ubiquinone/menaquinone biosynthesis C-methylase UbiE